MITEPTWEERKAQKKAQEAAVLEAIVSHWRARKALGHAQPTCPETAKALGERLSTVKRIVRYASEADRWPEDLKQRGPRRRGNSLNPGGGRFGELRIIAAYYALAQTALSKEGEPMRPSTWDVADAVGVSQPRVSMVVSNLRSSGRLPEKLKAILELPARKGGRGHKRLAA